MERMRVQTNNFMVNKGSCMSLGDELTYIVVNGNEVDCGAAMSSPLFLSESLRFKFLDDI